MFANKTKFPSNKKNKKGVKIEKIIGEKFIGYSLYYRVLFSDTGNNTSWINSIVKDAKGGIILPENIKESHIIEWNNNKMKLEKLRTLISEEEINTYFKPYSKEYDLDTILRYSVELINKYFYNSVLTDIDNEDALHSYWDVSYNFIKTFQKKLI